VLLCGLLGSLQYWNMTFPPCLRSWCYMLASTAPLTLQFYGATYTVDLTTSMHLTTVLLDRIVILPTLFLNATRLIGSDDNKRFQATCDVISNDMKSACLRFHFWPTARSSFRHDVSVVYRFVTHALWLYCKWSEMVPLDSAMTSSSRLSIVTMQRFGRNFNAKLLPSGITHVR